MESSRNHASLPAGSKPPELSPPSAPPEAVAKPAAPKAPELKPAPKERIEPISAEAAEEFTNLGHFHQSHGTPDALRKLFAKKSGIAVKHKKGGAIVEDPKGKRRIENDEPENDEAPEVDVEAGLPRRQLAPGLFRRNVVAGEGPQGLIVKVPKKNGRTSASWEARPRVVPEKYEPNPSSEFKKVRKEYQDFLVELLDILSTNEANREFWDTTEFVAAMFNLFLALLAGIRLIYNNASTRTNSDVSVYNSTYNNTNMRPYTQSDLIFYTFMDSLVLFTGFSAAIVALWARHSRNNNDKMLREGEASLKAMEEDSLSTTFARR